MHEEDLAHADPNPGRTTDNLVFPGPEVLVP